MTLRLRSGQALIINDKLIIKNRSLSEVEGHAPYHFFKALVLSEVEV